LISPFFLTINWNNFLPTVVAGYFYDGTGSLFPFFPWAGYVIAGGILGAYLAKNPLVFKSSKFSLWLLFAGIILIIASQVTAQFSAPGSVVNSATTSLIIYRVGFVLLLNALVSFIALKVDTIPKLVILIGRNTLLIYVVHLLILYGSAWNPGVYGYLAHSFMGWQSFISAIIMFGLMSLMVLLLNILKIRNKELVT
jgi:hypothetical protein